MNENEKQAIEEMAEYIYGNGITNDTDFREDCRSIARDLYNAGYRKQKEGEWQTAPDGTHWCSECGHDATYTYDGTEICGVACPFCGAHMKGGTE